MNNIENKLKEFYLKLDEYRVELKKINSKVNIFDVLKVDNYEIRHSNFLAWLFNPNENHGLGNQFLKRFLLSFFNSHFEHLNNKHGKIFWDLTKLDYSSFNVYREYPVVGEKRGGIDLLICSDVEKVVIVIENKVKSNEHSNQLLRYRRYIENMYADYKKIYVYLTPNSRAAEDELERQEWKEYGYDEICSILEDLYDLNSKRLTDNVKNYIRDYIEVVRRDIMQDNSELKEICAKIYAEYKDVIELINQNIPDERSAMSEKIRTLVKDEGFKLDSERANVYIHFTTERLRKIFKDTGDGEWCKKLNNVLLFEIDNFSTEDLQFACVLGPSDDGELREKIFNFAKANPAVFPNAKNLNEKFASLKIMKLNYKSIDSDWAKIVRCVHEIEDACEKEFKTTC